MGNSVALSVTETGCSICVTVKNFRSNSQAYNEQLQVFGEKLASISFRPTKNLMNQPCMLRAAILDLDERVKFDFHTIS